MFAHNVIVINVKKWNIYFMETFWAALILTGKKNISVFTYTFLIWYLVIDNIFNCSLIKAIHILTFTNWHKIKIKSNVIQQNMLFELYPSD